MLARVARFPYVKNAMSVGTHRPTIYSCQRNTIEINITNQVIIFHFLFIQSPTLHKFLSKYNEIPLIGEVQCERI